MDRPSSPSANPNQPTRRWRSASRLAHVLFIVFLIIATFKKKNASSDYLTLGSVSGFAPSMEGEFVENEARFSALAINYWLMSEEGGVLHIHAPHPPPLVSLHRASLLQPYLPTVEAASLDVVAAVGNYTCEITPPPSFPPPTSDSCETSGCKMVATPSV